MRYGLVAGLIYWAITVLPAYDPAVGDIIGFQVGEGVQPEPLVQLATGSRWIHVGLVVRLGDEWGMVDARSEGVGFRPLAEVLHAHRPPAMILAIRRLPGLEPEARGALTGYAVASIGKEYDRSWIWNDTGPDPALYCSELVAKAFRVAGHEVGLVQRAGEMATERNEAAVRRFTRGQLQPHHQVLTPASLMDDPDLQEVAIDR